MTARLTAEERAQRANLRAAGDLLQHMPGMCSLGQHDKCGFRVDCPCSCHDLPVSDARSAVAEQPPINVTATDPATGDSETQRIWDDYCIVAAGSAEVTDITMHRKDDGTATHVITVKGVRRG